MSVVLRCITLFLVFSLGLCSCVRADEPNAQKHIISFYDEAEWIGDFSDEESEDLLRLFSVIIPESEETAYIHSLGRIDGDASVMYFIEIGGVVDYDNFFAENAGDPYESGTLTLSTNEIYGNRETDYYITYSQHFRKSQVANPEEANVIFEALDDIYYNH